MKTIIKERLIAQDATFVYAKWTTKDGLNSFFSVDNSIEIKVNGKYEIYFDNDPQNRMRGSEGCKVIDFIPNVRLAFTWNMPPSIMELRSLNVFTTVILTFSEKDGKTLIRLQNFGYLDSEEWEQAYNYFEKAWDYVLDNLVKAC